MSTRWTKEAKAARDSEGNLLIWEPSADTDEVDDETAVDLQSKFPLGYASLTSYCTIVEAEDDDDEDCD